MSSGSASLIKFILCRRSIIFNILQEITLERVVRQNFQCHVMLWSQWTKNLHRVPNFEGGISKRKEHVPHSCQACTISWTAPYCLKCIVVFSWRFGKIGFSHLWSWKPHNLAKPNSVLPLHTVKFRKFFSVITSRSIQLNHVCIMICVNPVWHDDKTSWHGYEKAMNTDTRIQLVKFRNVAFMRI